MTENSRIYFKEIFEDTKELILCTDDKITTIIFATKSIYLTFGIDFSTQPHPNNIMPSRTLNRIKKTAAQNKCAVETFVSPYTGSPYKCTVTPSYYNNEKYLIMYFNATSSESLQNIQRSELKYVTDTAEKSIAQYTLNIASIIQMIRQNPYNAEDTFKRFSSSIMSSILNIRRVYQNLTLILNENLNIPDCQYIDVNLNLFRLISMMSKHIGKYKVDFEINLFKSALFIEMPYEYFDILICNLVSNSIKHSSDKVRVSITTHDNGKSVQIVVADSGNGCKQIQALLDNPFDDSDDFIKPGLGLAVIKKIVKDYGGNISVFQENQHGNTIGISFPKAKMRNAVLRTPEEYYGQTGEILNAFNINLADVLDIDLTSELK